MTGATPLDTRCPLFPTKEQYYTKSRAKQALRKWSVQHRGWLETYRCDGCDLFHIGTKTSKLDSASARLRLSAIQERRIDE